MPSYTYKCPKCGHEFEGSAKMSDPNPPCPQEGCSQPEVNKTFKAAPAFHLKGGGWAADGYGSK